MPEGVGGAGVEGWRSVGESALHGGGAAVTSEDDPDEVEADSVPHLDSVPHVSVAARPRGPLVPDQVLM